MSVLESIVQATAGHRKVALAYRSATGEETERQVLPYLVIKDKKDRIYLWAWCFLREDARTFRMDRIVGIRVFKSKVARKRYKEYAVGTKLEVIGLVSGDVLAIVN